MVKFTEIAMKNMKKDCGIDMGQYLWGHLEETQQGRVNFTAAFVAREINKGYHPFQTICKYYAERLVRD